MTTPTVLTNFLNYGQLPTVPVTASLDQDTTNQVNQWIAEIIVVVIVLMLVGFIMHRESN